MVDFPADIIIEILSQLPVTSLLRFRLISISCQSLIDSQYFKTLHLNKFRRSKSHLILRDSLYRLYAVDFPTLSTVVNLEQPVKSFDCSRIIIGSCNGLLCIKSFLIDFAIWSPFLRKDWNIPCNPSMDIFNFKYDFGSGFGFDPLTGDYKLVRISYFDPLTERGYELKVSLFSCRTNAWRTLPNMPFTLSCFRNNYIAVSVDHALHWVAVKWDNKLARPNLIVAFDLRFEVFNEVPLPELGDGFEINVSRLGKCLSIVVNYHNQNTEIDIWVMKLYGCKDSWSKLFTLVQSPKLILSRLLKPPSYYSDDNGTKVLFKEKGRTKKLTCYNLKSKQASLVKIPRMSIFLDATIWVESLVQPPFPSEAAKANFVDADIILS